MERKYLYPAIALLALLSFYAFFSQYQIKQAEYRLKQTNSKIDLLEKKFVLLDARSQDMKFRIINMEKRYEMLQKDISRIKRSLYKTANYINKLEKKLWKAIMEKNEKKIAGLRLMLSYEMDKKWKLESAMREKEQESSKVLQAKAEIKTMPLNSLVDVGLSGGAAMFGVGNVLPLSILNISEVQTKAYYGAGADFNVFAVRSEGVYKLPRGFTGGLSLDFADYTENVEGVLGMRSPVLRGGKVGVGVFGGRKVGALDIRLGYSPVLGVTLLNQYRF